MVSISSRTLTLDNELFRDSGSPYSLSLLGEGAGSDGGSSVSSYSPETGELGATLGCSPAEQREEEEDEEEQDMEYDGSSLHIFLGTGGDEEDLQARGQEVRLPQFPLRPPSPFSPTLEDIEEFLREKMELVREGLLVPAEEPSPASVCSSSSNDSPSASEHQLTPPSPSPSASACGNPASTSCQASDPQPDLQPAHPPPAAQRTSSLVRSVAAVATPSSTSTPAPAPSVVLGTPVVLQLRSLPHGHMTPPSAGAAATPAAAALRLAHLVLSLQGTSGTNFALLSPQGGSAHHATLVTLSGGLSDQKYVKIAPLPITMRTLEITSVAAAGAGAGSGGSLLKAVAPRVARVTPTETLRVHKCSHPGCSPARTNFLATAAHTRGIKPYECSLCDKKFARSDHLSKHTKVHRGSRPSRIIGVTV
ncbi:hypothetical protein CRUP_020771 [Coryphaenoides rupestris]|nr:hypothetical protein CRUP_020771 [Coryphaenoides rupestris]